MTDKSGRGRIIRVPGHDPWFSGRLEVAELLKRVGFFRELHSEPSLPSIRDSVCAEGHPDNGRIVAYLEGGVCLAAAGAWQRDVLDPSSGRGTCPDMMTDGVWLWPRELAYYVGTYRVELPEEFVAHMRQAGWAISALGDDEVESLCDWFFGEWRQ
jgi:hypothetical protein